jgi:hypothetical protein
VSDIHAGIPTEEGQKIFIERAVDGVILRVVFSDGATRRYFLPAEVARELVESVHAPKDEPSDV